MKLSEFGTRILAFSFFLIFFNLLFFDYIVFASIVFVFLLFILDAVVLKFSNVELDPRELRVSMTAGENISFDLIVKKPAYLRFSHAKAEKPMSFESNRISLNPKIFGIYRSSLILAFKFLGLFLKELSLKSEAKVYPRFFREFLIALGMIGEGKPSKEAGIGLEYFGSREYVPGDDLRAIDWKATARRQKIFVKEFHKEAGRGAIFVYDLRSPGEVCADEVAKAFLSSLISIDQPISLLIHNGEKVLYHAEKIDRLEALKISLKHIFERFFSNPETFEIFEPKTRRAILSILRSLGKEIPLKESPLDLIKKSNGDVFIFAYPYDVADLLSVLEELRFAGRKAYFYIPKKPWLDSKSLEDAYIDYISYQKIVRALRKICEVRIV